MKNPAPYIRQQLYALLDGAVVYNDLVVPVFESDNNGENPAYQIIIMGMDGTPDNDKASYNSDYSTILEIISEGHSWVRKHVDVIGNTVMELLKPTLYTTGLPDSEEWQVTNLTITPPTYLTDEGAGGTKIMRLILRLDFTITQR